MLDPLLLKPFLAVILITISCSLLGVFVLWKKLSYFGDALSHAILLGLVLGVIFQTDQVFSLIIFACAFAFLVWFISQNSLFAKDTIIMILSYFAIAVAVILNDIWLQNFRFNPYIFGDPLAVGSHEIQALTAITVITISYVTYSFKRILLTQINSDLAKIEGIKTEFWNLSFLILLALMIALSVKIVGIFLMTALLILPAAIARIFSISAKQMLATSLVVGTLISVVSFQIANTRNLTISSTIIAVFSVVFFLSLLVKTWNAELQLSINKIKSRAGARRS